MIKKIVKDFMWKWFPPREVTADEIEMAHMEFDNLRRHIMGINTTFYAGYPAEIVDNARRNYERLVRMSKRYEEYKSRK